MTPSEAYKAGKLQEAIDGQVQRVKTNPADHGQRVFLFELLVFSGELDRARRQIDAVQVSEPELEMAVQGYRKLLDAEQFRRRVFAEGIMPQFLKPPPEHLGKRLEAVQMLRAGNLAEAGKVLRELNADLAGPGGTLNGKPFTALHDCDDRFGPTLEVMAHGDYYWLPLEHIESLVANPPRFPRDLIWLPARLAVQDGPAGDVFLPLLYPGSHEQADDQLRLGRATDWREAQNGPVCGVGARLFLVDDDGVPLVDWRHLEVGAE